MLGSWHLVVHRHKDVISIAIVSIVVSIVIVSIVVSIVIVSIVVSIGIVSIYQILLISGLLMMCDWMREGSNREDRDLLWETHSRFHQPTFGSQAETLSSATPIQTKKI